MAIRADLLPKPLDDETVQRLTELGKQIVGALYAGQDTQPLVASFNAATGQNYAAADFDAVAASEEMRTFVERSLRASPRRRPDVTDDDLVEIIAHVVGPCIKEGRTSELDYWLAFLDRHLPHPGISDLIFYREDLDTPEKILAEAKAYKVIRL